MTNTDGKFGPDYWVAGISNKSNTYIFKAAVWNASSEQNFVVAFPSLTSGKTATLTL